MLMRIRTSSSNVCDLIETVLDFTVTEVEPAQSDMLCRAACWDQKITVYVLLLKFAKASYTIPHIFLIAEVAKMGFTELLLS
ncbi:hypothetical protein Smp_104530 [Schistosoma mansoni]|uniref:Protein kinase domain-containing protein n=1 Tax=Schistosoma mansoni TaxID=6183 RepID=C4QPU3_SCHMA|nr:hypothetical protein Smp_104530 [Schistosoma mansoni]|eukprot:XP_018644494.1 hypothetical protein Smp_104530 [Schistosoma mansoni]